LHMPITQGAEIYYCESTDKLAQYLTEVSPSVCTAVPRLYDMLYTKIRAGVESSSGAKRWLFNKTVGIGTKRADGQSLSVSEMLLDPLLTKLVRKKLLQRFGGRIKYFVSGGAALNPEVGSFFTALGVGIIQGYGQTEASPLITVNRPGDVVMDSVGSAFDGVALRLTEEGELLVKGPNVMKGYWRDEASTAMTIRDGWLYTGDLATIDDRGIVRITGRKKDLIVTSGGDNIAPSKIEGLLTLEKEVDQAVLIGDGKPWLAAILVPSEDLLNSVDDQKQINATLNAVLKRINESLNPAERVRKFILHNEPFTIDNGFVTPTQKIKRGLVIERFEEQINSLY
jgi:long-chain acyl-CoA synthetase